MYKKHIFVCLSRGWEQGVGEGGGSRGWERRGQGWGQGVRAGGVSRGWEQGVPAGGGHPLPLLAKIVFVCKFTNFLLILNLLVC